MCARAWLCLGRAITLFTLGQEPVFIREDVDGDIQVRGLRILEVTRYRCLPRAVGETCGWL